VPQLPRQYREHKKLTPGLDIASNIKIQIVFWVFATDSNRGCEKRGKQPLWLSKVMGYHIQPIARKLGIQKRIGWHTFRRTYSSILKDNGEDVKVVQELLRHASTKVTLDVYAQALTPAKRAAPRKVVLMIRENLSVPRVYRGQPGTPA
jgi:integrase